MLALHVIQSHLRSSRKLVSQTSQSIIVQRRAFNPPIAPPLPYVLAFSTRTIRKKREKGKMNDFHRYDRLKCNQFRLTKNYRDVPISAGRNASSDESMAPLCNSMRMPETGFPAFSSASENPFSTV